MHVRDLNIPGFKSPLLHIINYFLSCAKRLTNQSIKLKNNNETQLLKRQSILAYSLRE